MLGLTNFDSIVAYLRIHGYWLMFLLMCFEGPVVIAAAAFAASFGIFNIYVVILIGIFGDLIPDLFYFYGGRFGGKAILKKEHFLGVKKEKIVEWSDKLHDHFKKSIIIMKLTPLITLPGLIALGMSKISAKKFISYNLLIIIPKVLISVLIGFYFGKAFEKISTYMAIGQWVIVVFIIGVITLPLIIKWFMSKKFGDKI